MLTDVIYCVHSHIIEHGARLHAAEGEKSFHNAGKAEGIEIWRIENLGVRQLYKTPHSHLQGIDPLYYKQLI